MSRRLPSMLVSIALPGVLLGGCEPAQGVVDPSDPSTADPVSPSTPSETDPPAPSESSPDLELVLRLPEGVPPEITLDLDRSEVQALFGPVAEQITLLTLDTAPYVAAALDEVKAACGTDWRQDKRNPTYNCELTPLGRTFRGPDGRWQTSPEYSLVRILTMTPANAEVDGTSVALLSGVADFLRLGGGFNQILADTFDIPRTREILETASLAQAIVTQVAGPHPGTLPDGALTITLADALDDLRPLARRLGPTPHHPGLVEVDAGTFGRVFSDAFRMVAQVQSNLRILEGLDLQRGKDYIGVVVDPDGGDSPKEISFDFADPDRFRIEGIVDTPTLDMRFTVFEDPTFVPACTSNRNRDCRNNLPGQPISGSFVWGRPTHTTEYVIGSAGWTTYGSLRKRICFIGCLVEIGVGQGSDPAGFTRFGGLASLLAPDPQYVWELILEIAQVRLHQTPFGTIPEGEANVAFDLRDIPIGLTGPQAAEAVRPFLQEQASLVSHFLLGDFRKNNGRVDLFWRRTEDGNPTLFFIGREDLNPSDPYPWPRPGFFSDPDATQQIGRTQLSGVSDTTHLKWQPPPGVSHVYVVDRQGQIHRLDLFLGDPSDPRAPLVIEASRVAHGGSP